MYNKKIGMAATFNRLRHFRRKYGNRRGGFRSKKRTWRRRTGVKKVVKRMLQARGLNKPEIKHINHDAYNAAISSLFNQTPLIIPPVTQGDGSVGEFVGQKIAAKWLKIQGMVYSTQSDTYPVRLILLEDMQPTDDNLVLAGATSRGYEVLQNQDIYALYNNIYPRRWKMLWDKMIMLGPGNTATDAEVFENRKLFSQTISLGNAQISYAQGAVSGYYPTNRSYYFYAIGQVNGLFITFHIDFAYTDV